LTLALSLTRDLMPNDTHTFLRDTLRRTRFYWWLRQKPLVRQIREIFRLSKLFNLVEAVKLSSALWNKPGCLVEINSPNIPHPIFLRSCTSDSRVFYEIFGDKIYDCGKLENVAYIIDAGANIGAASIFFAMSYPKAKIVAVDPSSSNISILRKNISFYPNIVAREAAIWPRKEALHFTNPDFEHWALRVEKCDEEDANFAAVTIPMLMEEQGLPRIDILKMDIEGAEKEVLLESDPSWLHSVRLLIIELHGEMARERFDEVNSMMEQHGLHLIRGGENCIFSRVKEDQLEA